MAKVVIKKDGSKQEFDSEKIKNSIRNAAEEAGLDQESINEVAAKVSNEVINMAGQIEEEISSSQLREKILSLLDELEESVSQAWRDYDKKYKS